MLYYLSYYRKKLEAYLKNKAARKSVYGNIGILNPSIGTSNLGDLIIYEAVYKHLREIYPKAFFTNFPTQIHTSYDGKLLMSERELLVVAGTNLLSSNMDSYYQWKIGPSDKFFLKNKVLLMGVGWWQYQQRPNSYTKKLLHAVLHKDRLHAVRDGYTEEMLSGIGITNVLNTTCPTLWDLNAAHCAAIPMSRADNVVTTLTFYKKDRQKDRRMLELLEHHYEKVYVWIQGTGDLDYLEAIYPNSKAIHLVAPTLEDYDALLAQETSLDYVGTRLHAGVRALQKNRRTLILAVDNRAMEIGKDTGLHVIKRENVEDAIDFIRNDYVTSIVLPEDKIAQWKHSLKSN